MRQAHSSWLPRSGLASAVKLVPCIVRTAAWSAWMTGTGSFGDVRPAHGFAFARLTAGGATITQLAEHLDLTRQAAAQLVGELIAKGYVERHPHPRDARARLIVLTEKGWACTRAAEAAITDTLRPWEAALGPERLLALRNDLLQVASGGPLRPTW